jgi:FtsZ-interacting cell division protein ZipA
MANVSEYILLIRAIQEVADKLVGVVKDFAVVSLTPEELANLEAAWQADVDRTKKNAGL